MRSWGWETASRRKTRRTPRSEALTTSKLGLPHQPPLERSWWSTRRSSSCQKPKYQHCFPHGGPLTTPPTCAPASRSVPTCAGRCKHTLPTPPTAQRAGTAALPAGQERRTAPVSVRRVPALRHGLPSTPSPQPARLGQGPALSRHPTLAKAVRGSCGEHHGRARRQKLSSPLPSRLQAP